MKAALVLLLAASIAACAPDLPSGTAAVESLGMRAAQTGEPAAMRRLEHWAETAPAPLAGLAAQELGLALARHPDQAALARRWLDRAARAGASDAAYALGEAHRRGLLGLTTDSAAAKPWYERAAGAGHGDALLALARAARNGDAEPRDPARAFLLLQQASEHGSAQAMYLLSQAYAQGEGTPTDTGLARHWLEEAAERDLPAAMQDWALALEDGRLGVARNAAGARLQWREAHEERPNNWNR